MASDNSQKFQTIVAYTTDPTNSALTLLRYVDSLRLTGRKIVFGKEGTHINTNLVHQADLVLIQRNFPCHFDACVEIFQKARSSNKPIIYEIDDLLFALPEYIKTAWQDLSRYLHAMLWIAAESDGITVSTPELLRILRPINPNIWLLPNYLDDTLWELKPPRQASSDNLTTIGYMGGETHQNDLIYILPVLKQLLESYQGKVSLQFWGVNPGSDILAYPGVNWTPMDILDYSEFVRYFNQQTCDIYVAPLENNIFNRAKSHIKFLEFSALGIPGVLSKFTPYENIVKHGENGFLATTQEEWQYFLQVLIEKPEKRFAIASAAQNSIRRDWLLTEHAGQWPETYTQLIEKTPPDKTQDLDTIPLVALIDQQLQNTHGSLLQKIQSLEGNLNAQNFQVQQLDEILQSRSWRLIQSAIKVRHKLVPLKSTREKILSRLGLLSTPK